MGLPYKSFKIVTDFFRIIFRYVFLRIINTCFIYFANVRKCGEYFFPNWAIRLKFMPISRA